MSVNINFKVNEKLLYILEKLRIIIEVNNCSEVFIQALGYFDFFIQKIQEGNEVYLIKDGDFSKGERVIFPNMVEFKGE